LGSSHRPAFPASHANIGGQQVVLALRRVNWRQLATLAVMIMAVQAAYWVAIDKPLFRADPGQSPPLVKLVDVEIARLAEPGFAAARNAAFKPVTLPWTYCCDSAAFAVRGAFTLDAIPARGLGIISDLQVDNYQLAINGTVLVARGRLSAKNPSFHGQIKYLTRIPAGVLRQGRNELMYVTVRDGFPYTDIIAPRIAEHDALDQHTARRLFFIGDFYRLSGFLLGLLGLLATLMVFRSDDWRFAAWLSALCAAFVGYMLYTTWLDPPLDGWGRMLAFYAIYLFIPTALICFIDSWTRHPLRHFQAGVLAVYGLITGVIAWHIYRVPMPAGFDQPVMLWVWSLVAAAVVVIGRLAWHFATRAEDRLIESALLSVLAVALVVDAVSNLFPELGVREGNLLNSSAFLLLAMTAAFLARNFRLFQSQAALNAMLQAKVDQREAELLAAAAREQALVRQQAFDEERRRIMRDLHDGLGSQLMSIMLAARVGVADPAAVAEGLQAVIDELRLMVDSMDSVGESLGSALATFKARVQPRVEAVGIDLVWHEDEGIGTIGDFGPRDVLQLFRVLQEAVTNALKHAHCRQIAISAIRTKTGLRLEIADDGTGLDASGGAGRGLANMRARAAAVGGQIEILPGVGGCGTRVVLDVPIRRPDAAS
jgi:two-component system sensor histidine kinase UhpB